MCTTRSIVARERTLIGSVISEDLAERQCPSCGRCTFGAGLTIGALVLSAQRAQLLRSKSVLIKLRAIVRWQDPLLDLQWQGQMHLWQRTFRACIVTARTNLLLARRDRSAICFGRGHCGTAGDSATAHLSTVPMSSLFCGADSDEGCSVQVTHERHFSLLLPRLQSIAAARSRARLDLSHRILARWLS